VVTLRRVNERLDGFIASPRRGIWTMAVPMMAGMLVHTLYIVVDTAFIGRLGTEALAAATFVGPLFFVMVTLTMGLATAVTALTAQALGRREAGGGDAVAGTAMTTGLIVGVALGAAGLAFGRATLAVLGADGVTGDLAWQYFEIICWLLPSFFVSSVLRSVLTGEGDARTPTVVLAISTFINLGFDALFIFGLGLGIRGAALATGVAQAFSLVAFLLLVVRRREAFVRFRLAALVPRGDVLWRIAALAVPTSGGMLAMSLGGMAINRILSSYGETAVAAYGAASKVDMIVGMPIFGLAGAAVTVVGMFAGAGRPDLIRKVALYTYRWALTLAFVLGAAAYAASDAILIIFTRDPAALDAGRTYLGYMVFAYPMMAVGMTTGRLLQGLGHGVPSLVITAVRVLVVAVPAAYVAAYVLETSLAGVWSSLLLGGACATVASILWVWHLVWRRDPVAALEPAATRATATS
jgi:putative MATE family efflux protein